MNALLSQRAVEALAVAPPLVQKAFLKKYNESADLWQARVNDDWRFFFRIEGDTYRIEGILPHPK